MSEPPQPPEVLEIRAANGRLRLLKLSDGRELLFTDEACERCHVERGTVLTPELLAALDAVEQRVNAHDAALRLLAHRARSESEMRTRLKMRGFDPATVDEEVERLRNAGLLNDAQFARAWVEDRKRSAPRGRRMLRYELLGRGIDPEEVDEATDGIDDLATARQLAVVRGRRYAAEPYESFVAHVGDFLRRRGFDYEVIATAVREAWAVFEEEREREAAASQSPG
jgi:regulatory protein